MRTKIYILVMTIIWATNFTVCAWGQYLSIHTIQFTNNPDGASSYDGNIVNCKGGIVVRKFIRTVPRLLIQDPNNSRGWGGIQVKDRYNITNGFQGIELGDRITLANVKVEEFRGTTFLQLYESLNPQITVISRGNKLPEPILVEPNQIAAPRQDAYGNFLVADHRAEKYESMLLILKNVTVGQMGRGKANDNYVLESVKDPGKICWAADYINEDKNPFEPYLPAIKSGQRICTMVGMLEQYTNFYGGFDYYQLLTTIDDDILLPGQADLDANCRVDFYDFCLFSQQWLKQSCDQPKWCGGADFNHNHAVELSDLVIFAKSWLEGIW